MIQVMRGVMLRGAGWEELYRNALVMTAMGITLIFISILRFKKRVG